MTLAFLFLKNFGSVPLGAAQGWVFLPENEGVYVASESSSYRVLRAAQEQHHRGRAKASSKTEPQRHVAHGPNELWSWGVTYLPSQVHGLNGLADANTGAVTRTPC